MELRDIKWRIRNFLYIHHVTSNKSVKKITLLSGQKVQKHLDLRICLRYKVTEKPRVSSVAITLIALQNWIV